MAESPEIPMDLYIPIERLKTEAEYSGRFLLFAHVCKEQKVGIAIPSKGPLTAWPFSRKGAVDNIDLTRDLFLKWVCNAAVRDLIETLLYCIEDIYFLFILYENFPDQIVNVEKLKDVKKKFEKDWISKPWQGTSRRGSKLEDFISLGFPVDPLSPGQKVIRGFLDIRNCMAHHQSVVSEQFLRDRESIEAQWLTIEKISNGKISLKNHSRRFEKGEFIQLSFNEAAEVITTIKYMAEHKYHPLLIKYFKDKGYEIIKGRSKPVRDPVSG